MDHIAERIRQGMQSRGLSESALADATLIPRVTLRRRLVNPGGLTLDEITRIAGALEITVRDLTFSDAA